MRIACVGEATADEIRKYKLEVELIPSKSTAEDLAKDLIATNSLDSANVLVITGNRNRDVLVGLLESLGHAIVDTLPIYQTDFADVVDAEDYEEFRAKWCRCSCIRKFFFGTFLCRTGRRSQSFT